MLDLDFDGIKLKCFERQESRDNLGFILGELEGGCYAHFDVTGRDVLDVGAYMGETAIWFVWNGARRVYALEPFESYTLIEENARLNGCDTQITPIRGGIFNIDCDIRLSTFENSGGTHLLEYAERKNLTSGSEMIPMYTLETLVRQASLEDAVLKMDCEGSEFFALPGTPRDIIRKFKYVMLEVHYFAGDPGQLYQYFIRNDFKLEVLPAGDSFAFVYAERLD